jgi:hypothetical protein
MKRKIGTLALALSVAVPSAAYATGSKSYDVCGGSYGSSWSGFAFCASVNLTVTKRVGVSNIWTVALQVANLSGLNGSYAYSAFTQIGLDNIISTATLPTWPNKPNIEVWQDADRDGDQDLVCSNPYNSQDPNLKCWRVTENTNATGGFNIDFLDQSSNGFNRDIMSLCVNNEPTLLYTCLSQYPVTLKFDINKDFDPNTSGQIYLHAETFLPPDGQYGVAQCETGGSVTSTQRCTNVTFAPPVTATPEPATLALLGSGMAALGGPGFLRLRRRNKKTDANA